MALGRRRIIQTSSARYTINTLLLPVAHRDCPYVKVRLGEWDTRSTVEPYGFREYKMATVYIHPDFNSANLRNDIAVIKLSQSVPLGTYPNIVPACLTRQNAAFTGKRFVKVSFCKSCCFVHLHLAL